MTSIWVVLTPKLSQNRLFSYFLHKYVVLSIKLPIHYIHPHNIFQPIPTFNESLNTFGFHNFLLVKVFHESFNSKHTLILTHLSSTLFWIKLCLTKPWSNYFNPNTLEQVVSIGHFKALFGFFLHTGVYVTEGRLLY